MTQAAIIALAIVLPGPVSTGPIDLAVVCRERNGAWPSPSWHAHAAPPQILESREGRRCRVLARPRASTFYAASREVLWRRDAQPVYVEPGWLRTVRMDAQEGKGTWLGVEDDPLVECQSAESGAPECWFVPWESAGVMIAESDGGKHVAIFARGMTVSSASLDSGRLLRVHAPSSSPIEARALRLERSLRTGAGRLLEARPSPGVMITAVGPRAVWVSGAGDRAFLEIRSGSAAPQRIPLAALAGAPDTPVDVRLPPGEVVEGDVRGFAGPADGATVILSRIVDEGDTRTEEEERPRERIAERVADESGRFRFDGLTRDRHELLAIHPVHGRALRVVSPPEYPRLVLRPRARIRGRILRNGIPVPGALVQVLPALDAVASARNPLLLASASARSGTDGRFEINAGDQGRVVVAISSEEGSARVDLGDTATLGEIADLGDIRITDPPAIELIADLPRGCALHAAGPMGSAGLSIVAAVERGEARWRFSPPVSGRWFFAALCGGRELALEPAIVDIGTETRQPVVLRIRR